MWNGFPTTHPCVIRVVGFCGCLGNKPRMLWVILVWKYLFRAKKSNKYSIFFWEFETTFLFGMCGLLPKKNVVQTLIRPRSFEATFTLGDLESRAQLSWFCIWVRFGCVLGDTHSTWWPDSIAIFFCTAIVAKNFAKKRDIENPMKLVTQKNSRSYVWSTNTHRAAIEVNGLPYVWHVELS